MKTTLKVSITSKVGVTINAGESVTVAFDAKTKSGEPFASAFSVTAADGRRVVTRNTAKIGIKVPGTATLEKYSYDGIAKTVFGDKTEPDGWTNGAPSWLLFLGLI